MKVFEWDRDAVSAIRGRSWTGVRIARENLLVAQRSLTQATGAIRRYNDLLKSDSAERAPAIGCQGPAIKPPSIYERKRDFEVHLRHVSENGTTGS